MTKLIPGKLYVVSPKEVDGRNFILVRPHSKPDSLTFYNEPVELIYAGELVVYLGTDVYIYDDNPYPYVRLIDPNGRIVCWFIGNVAEIPEKILRIPAEYSSE